MPANEPLLSNSEQITLRRVAHGQSDAARLPAADLARLRELNLIQGSAPAPSLTPAGRRQFLGLAKPVGLKSFDAESTMAGLLARLGARSAGGKR
jgi:hypothetical protein